jgi:hypothetical protein
MQLTPLEPRSISSTTTQSPATLTPVPVQFPLCEYPAEAEETLVTNPLLAVAASGLPWVVSGNPHILIVLAATVTVTELGQTWIMR